GTVPSGKEGPAAPEPGLEEDGEAARRGPAPSQVPVEAGDHGLREAPEQAQLLGAEGRAERGHDLADPGLCERDHVEVTLDHDGAVGPADRVAREREAVERVALAEDGRLGGVEILGWRIAARRSLGQDAAAEGDH